MDVKVLDRQGEENTCRRPGCGPNDSCQEPASCAPAATAAAGQVTMDPQSYLTSDGLAIERAGIEPLAWAVRDRFGGCLSTAGMWCDEPLPSNRAAEWLAQHRFASAELALAAVQARQCCNRCDDGDGGCRFPYYGLAPHVHAPGPIIGSTRLLPRGQWAGNFREDPDNPGCGTYERCPTCGRGAR